MEGTKRHEKVGKVSDEIFVASNYWEISQEGVLIKYKGPINEDGPEVIKIPDDVGGVKVTALGDKLFREDWPTSRNYQNLVQVILPSSVHTIGDNAFQGCSGLNYINLDNIHNLGVHAFDVCNLFTVSLGAGLNGIPDSAFRGNVNLTEVVFASLDDRNKYYAENEKARDDRAGFRIDMYAFCSTDVTKLELPPYTTYIDECALSIDDLAELTIPRACKCSWRDPLSNCINLKVVIIEGPIPEAYESKRGGCDEDQSAIQLVLKATYKDKSNYGLPSEQEEKDKDIAPQPFYPAIIVVDPVDVEYAKRIAADEKNKITQVFSYMEYKEYTQRKEAGAFSYVNLGKRSPAQQEPGVAKSSKKAKTMSEASGAGGGTRTGFFDGRGGSASASVDECEGMFKLEM